MRNIWILPDRQQTGVMRAIENDKLSLLHELVNVNSLPSVLSLGIPEEVFRKYGDESFLFGQFIKILNGNDIFCLSIPVGTDIKGRKVAITNLQFLESNEEPSLAPDIPNNIDEEEKRWIRSFSPTQDRNYRNKVKPIENMLCAVKSRNTKLSYASEYLRFAHYKPDWMPRQNIINRFKETRVLIFLLIPFFFIFCIYLIIFKS